jgi:hypothetical protein
VVGRRPKRKEFYREWTRINANKKVGFMNSIKISLTIALGAAESQAFSLADFVGDAGLVGVPAAWTAAGLGFKVSDAFAGTYSPLRDESGSVVQVSGIVTNAAAWYKLPDALRGAQFVKLWSQTAGSDTNQDAARSLVVMAKG